MIAIKCGTTLCEGLKEKFNTNAKDLIGTILLKYKEKRPMMQDEVHKFLEAANKCGNLEDFSSEIVPCITNIAPGVKLGTLKYVEKTALTTYIDVLQRFQPDLLPAVTKAIDDKDGGVRDTALHCMGILKGRLTESVTSTYTKKLVP